MKLRTLIMAVGILASHGAAHTVTDAEAPAVPNYYLIRHAEKNPDGTLSAKGLERAKCLIKVFGKSSDYNIKHIMTQTPYPGTSELDHTTQRPFNTTTPLAKSLGITIDHPCNFTETTCAGEEALKYTGPGNVLIAWEHDHLPAVAKAMGGKDVPKYHSAHFDLIYNLALPYTEVKVTTEDCAIASGAEHRAAGMPSVSILAATISALLLF